MGTLTIEEKRDREITVLRCSGDFLGENDRVDLKARVHGLVEAGTRFLLLDLEKVHHMNSCGLGALIATLTTLRKEEGEIGLTHVGPPIQYLLDLTRLAGVLQVFDSHEKALAHHRSRSARQ